MTIPNGIIERLPPGAASHERSSTARLTATDASPLRETAMAVLDHPVDLVAMSTAPRPGMLRW